MRDMRMNYIDWHYPLISDWSRLCENCSCENRAEVSRKVVFSGFSRGGRPYVVSDDDGPARNAQRCVVWSNRSLN